MLLWLAHDSISLSLQDYPLYERAGMHWKKKCSTHGITKSIISVRTMEQDSQPFEEGSLTPPKIYAPQYGVKGTGPLAGGAEPSPFFSYTVKCDCPV